MKLIVLNISMIVSILGFSQVDVDTDLFLKLKERDSLMFNEGLNKCNLELMASLVMDDLEFYHDKGGMTDNKQRFIEQIKSGPCRTGELENNRGLVKNSLMVYPLYNNAILYGAIQQGKHMFAETTARFTHLWLLESDEWKLSRVLSYDH